MMIIFSTGIHTRPAVMNGWVSELAFVVEATGEREGMAGV